MAIPWIPQNGRYAVCCLLFVIVEFYLFNLFMFQARNQSGNLGNGELQWFHPDAVTVSGGYLTITANRTAYGGQQYMSGLVDSKDKFFSTYGRYEIKARLPVGLGNL